MWILPLLPLLPLLPSLFLCSRSDVRWVLIPACPKTRLAKARLNFFSASTKSMICFESRFRWKRFHRENEILAKKICLKKIRLKSYNRSLTMDHAKHWARGDNSSSTWFGLNRLGFKSCYFLILNPRTLNLLQL